MISLQIIGFFMGCWAFGLVIGLSWRTSQILLEKAG